MGGDDFALFVASLDFSNPRRGCLRGANAYAELQGYHGGAGLGEGERSGRRLLDSRFSVVFLSPLTTVR